MKFLLDQDVYALTARFLQSLGHEVNLVAELGLAQADDAVLLARARALDRIFITRDRDFGGLAFVQKLGGGILYLRMTPATVNGVHQELQKVLQTYPEEVLRMAFVVVEPGRHRFRKLSLC